jgi:HEAT repeat protein
VDALQAAVDELVALAHSRPLHEYWHAVSKPRMLLLRNADRAAVLLAPALADPRPETRRFFALLLREIGKPGPLVALLADPDDETRLAACIALAREPHGRHEVGIDVYPPIDEALRHAILESLHAYVPWKPYIIEATIRICVALRDPDLGAFLASRIGARNWRELAMRSFRYARDGAAHLLRYVRDPDPATRMSACIHLTYSPPRDVADDVMRAALVERLDDVPDVAKYALRALRSYPDAALEPRIIELLPREEAIDALSTWRSQAALPALLDLARDGHRFAITRLERYPTSATIEAAWIAALDTKTDPFTKFVTAELLSKHGSSTAVPALQAFLAGDVKRLSKRWRKQARRLFPVRIPTLRAKPPLV